MRSSRSTVAAAPPLAATIGSDAEWLLTDGAGGYASGCADDLARRRYHGAWITRPAGSAKRFLAVGQCDERVVVHGAVHYLLHAHWRDQPGPTPPRVATSFVHRPLPAWTFRLSGDVAVERTYALQRATTKTQPCLLVHWRNRSATPLRIDVRPLLGFTDVDHLVPEGGAGGG